MSLSYFVRSKYHITTPYTGVNKVRGNLMLHGAVVVVAEETGQPLGVLTPRDILQRPHNLVIDCLTRKPVLDVNNPVEAALQVMQNEGTDVLLVQNDNSFEGLVFKNDLIKFLASKNIALENKVVDKTEQLQEANTILEKSEKVLKAIYDSIESVRFLVAPDYTILFFNKKAYQNSLNLHNTELKVGDCFLTFAQDTFNQQDDKFLSNFEMSLQDKFIVTENLVNHQDAAAWFRTEYCPIYDDERLIGVSLTISDISEQKQNELFIQKQNKILKEIIHDQSHGLRRPVANILGIIKLFGNTQFPFTDAEAVKMLESSATDLDNLIRDVVKKADYWTSTDDYRELEG